MATKKTRVRQHARKIIAHTSEPLPKLGVGLRLVQVYFLVILIAALTTAAAANPSQFTYDLSMVASILLAGDATLSMWSLQTRSKRSRLIVVISLVVTHVFMTADLFTQGSFTQLCGMSNPTVVTALVVADYVCAAAALLYILLSKHVRRVLAREYHYDDAPGGYTWDMPLRKRLCSWGFWRDLGLYFVAFSFLGHWVEMLFCQLIRLGIVGGEYDPSNTMLWDQWLYPFSAEGIAVALIVLLLHPLSRWLLKKTGNRTIPALILSFFANQIVCTSIDFTTGITANADYHLWDYSNMPFNFMGQICLQNSLVYSIAATVIVWVVYPLMDKGLRKLPKLVVDGAFWFLAGIYGFLALLHFMYWAPTGWIIG